MGLISSTQNTPRTRTVETRKRVPDTCVCASGDNWLHE